MILNCPQSQPNGFLAISSHTAKLLKSTMLFQTNFLYLAECDKEAFWDPCSLVFYTNDLLINPNKPPLIIFGSRAMVSKVEDVLLTLLRKEITRGSHSCLTHNDHIASILSSCMAHLGQIYKSLTIIINT